MRSCIRDGLVGAPGTVPAQLSFRDLSALRTVKALVDANKDQEVLIALYDELNDKDQLVPFFNVVQVIDVCKAAGVVNIKFQAPAQPM